MTQWCKSSFVKAPSKIRLPDWLRRQWKTWRGFLKLPRNAYNGRVISCFSLTECSSDWWTNQNRLFLENVSVAFGIATGRIWNSRRRRCRRSQKEYIWCFYKESFLSLVTFLRHSDWWKAISRPIRKKLKKSRKEFYYNAWVLCTMVWVSTFSIYAWLIIYES